MHLKATKSQNSIFWDQGHISFKVEFWRAIVLSIVNSTSRLRKWSIKNGSFGHLTGMESEDISAIKEFVQSVEDSLLFITMMVIAEGWGVVRCHIKHYRWTSLLCKCKYSGTSIGRSSTLQYSGLSIGQSSTLQCSHWVWSPNPAV